MTESKQAYRLFCEQEHSLPIFFQDWYLDAACGTANWEVLVIERNSKVVAVFPYFFKRKWGFKYLTMPPFVKFMGPYILPEYRNLKTSHNILEECIQRLPKLDCIKQNIHYTVQNWLPFHWNGFQQTTRYSYLLNLEELDTVFTKINRNMRRNIKKAQALVSVERGGDLAQFYEINKKSFERQGISIPYSLPQLEKHDAALVKRNARELFFAKDEYGQIHSAAYLIWDKRSSYYHLSGDHPELRQSGAGILLVWEAIQFTKKELGLDVFDFEGSMLKPVEQIRRQFGAKQQPYSYIWKYNSRLFKLIDQLKGNG